MRASHDPSSGAVDEDEEFKIAESLAQSFSLTQDSQDLANN